LSNIEVNNSSFRDSQTRSENLLIQMDGVRPIPDALCQSLSYPSISPEEVLSHSDLESIVRTESPSKQGTGEQQMYDRIMNKKVIKRIADLVDAMSKSTNDHDKWCKIAIKTLLRSQMARKSVGP